jgi:DNA-binding NtrC family response regulator
MSQRRHVAGGDTATLPSLPAADARSVGFWLCAFHGPAAPACMRIDRALRLGRDTDADVALDDPAASRAHAELRPSSDGVIAIDLESRNGTFLDGARIERAEIGRAATLRVGDGLFRVAPFAERWVPATEGPLVGGAALAMARRQVALVGPTPLAVLVLGETGTGKELIAHAVHAASARSGPFIAVNCAALPESLVEAELFGHARAAFTGASQARKGLFAAAAGGTLFLDEVGDLPLAAQAKLLRVLEDGEVRPVGSERSHKVDVRVVSATNRDLSAHAERGEFRSDLLARLAGVEIRLPPLRSRPEDIPSLAQHLLARAGHPGRAIESDAMEALALHSWPMNLRELDTVLRNAALVTSGSSIGFRDLPEPVRAPLTRARGGEASSARVEAEALDLRPRIERALAAHKGNVRQASRALGLSRGHIYRLLKRFELDPDSFRGER